MLITPDPALAGALRAVNRTIELALQKDRFTLEGGLRVALVEETGAVPSEIARGVFQRYGPPLTARVLRYVGPGPHHAPDPAEREAAAAALHELIEALVRDLRAAGALPFVPVGDATPQDPYESPTLHRAVHDVPHVVERKDARDVAVSACPPDARHRSPGAATRRRQQLAEGALQQAERTIEAVEWEMVDEQNQILLASLRTDQRIALLWLKEHELLVIGQGNVGYGSLAALAGNAAAGVLVASLQRGPTQGILRRTPTAHVSGLPDEEHDAAAATLLAYGVRTSFSARSRWDG
ncbi:hypothetical protein ACFYM7_30555 [Streptomyces cyaneofuscatus]|uniref:hypothetical protein n=1 Tax=Streptomyces cyaneofuscatus TaxID=66883 RepID=UPI0036AB3985